MKFLKPFGKVFKDGIPNYLADYYWWAYLWRPTTWFFDHQFIINLILFGQYEALLKESLEHIRKLKPKRCLQFTSVYGKLVPEIQKAIDSPLYVMDIADAQIDLLLRKTKGLHIAKMNAERVAFADNSFDLVVVFFLLHEMPHHARERALKEVIRICQSDGHILLVEYGARPKHHWLHRFFITRWLLGYFEPFLPEFWDLNLDQHLVQWGPEFNKSIQRQSHQSIFNGFYRVNLYSVNPA